MKTCTSCGVRQEESCFYPRGDATSGFRQPCTNCQRLKRPDRPCIQCGRPRLRKGRSSVYCPACYPKYRQAVNLCAAARYRSSKQGIPYDLTVSWVIERLGAPCPRTGHPFRILDKNKNMSDRHPMSPSLDKINPFAGYTKDNVQVVAWWYNCAKQQFTDAEVISLCRSVIRKADSSVTCPA